MKLLILFGLIASITALTDLEQWQEFKKTHHKSYRSLREESVRFNIFKETLQKINDHNEKYAKGETTYYLGINEFSDLTTEEFRSKFLTLSGPKDLNLTKHTPMLRDSPDSMDWREREATVGVKNQGGCGACWAFAATGAIESHYTLKYGNVIEVSEQNLVDCSYGDGNDGCNGGFIDKALSYVRDNGIMAEGDYQYEYNRGACRFDASRASAVRSTGFIQVNPGEDQLKEAVGNVGPVAVLINADGFQSYAGGVYNDAACSNSQNHAVVAVGYGWQDGLDYWLIRNSWGAGWGENGYFKLARNANGQCGFAYFQYYPLIA